MNLAELSIRNRTVTLVLTFVLLGGGLSAYQGMSRLEDPEFTIKDALVITPYPGASAAEVEEEVTDELEMAVQKLGQLDEVTSKTDRGLSTLTVSIKKKYDSATLPQVGIPAALLRRRPDIRRAERDVAAQSARIGIALADLYPSFALVGNISLAGESFSDLFQADSFDAFGGPTFRWAILNYGRIRNNVRVQDARFQQFVVGYENTVLVAQQEVESAIAGYLGSLRQVGLLADGVEASRRAVHLSNLQYREGTVDYVRVLNAQESLFAEQERLVGSRGSVALNLIALYKALGGGWEIRKGQDFVPEKIRDEMRARTDWGHLLSAEGQSRDVAAAASGTESDRGWWRWRRWWPPW